MANVWGLKLEKEGQTLRISLIFHLIKSSNNEIKLAERNHITVFYLIASYLEENREVKANNRENNAIYNYAVCITQLHTT